MAPIALGKKLIDTTLDEVYIIAEIGQNHQGDIDIAKQMILEAKKTGCDCVKFQKSWLTAKFTKSALDRPYSGHHSWGTTYGDHKSYLEFTYDQYKELQKFSQRVGIDFTASAMDKVSLSFLETLNVPFIKIGSGDCNNFPMLRDAAKLSRPLVISTGMQSMDSIEHVVSIMLEGKKTNYSLLHCVSSYPTKASDCNIRMISLLKKKFPNIVIGYSGHEMGIDITKAAVLLGARIVERHFTLNKHQKGSDHACSLDPKEMQELVKSIRDLKLMGVLKEMHNDPEKIITLLSTKTTENVRLALKSVTEKIVLPCEIPCKKKLGKSIVAARDLKKGFKLNSLHFEIKVSEPPGIPAEDYYKIIGVELLIDMKKDEPITYAHVILKQESNKVNCN